MAIKGSRKEESLREVRRLLALGQKTWGLSVADRSNFGYIYFDKGRICYASIVHRRDRLGDILVKHSKITQAQLDSAVHRQTKEHGKKLGEVLVGMAVITQADLERYMRVQIEESVYYLFTWTQGTFNFEADVRPERQDFLVSINPESLLLEGARRVDEWSLIEKKIPSFDLIFVVDKDRLAISEAQLTDTQQRILSLLDASRDVNQVIEDSGLGEFEMGKALYGLITAGIVHCAGRTASAEGGGGAAVGGPRRGGRGACRVYHGRRFCGGGAQVGATRPVGGGRRQCTAWKGSRPGAVPYRLVLGPLARRGRCRRIRAGAASSR